MKCLHSKITCPYVNTLHVTMDKACINCEHNQDENIIDPGLDSAIISTIFKSIVKKAAVRHKGNPVRATGSTPNLEAFLSFVKNISIKFKNYVNKKKESV